MLLQAGMAIEAHVRIGTLGALVTSNHFPGELFLLTAYHVLDDGLGDGPVTLPDDGNPVVAAYVAGPNTTLAEMDAAIARIIISDPFANFSNQVPGDTFRITRKGGPMKPQALVKYGAGTQETVCVMSAIFEEFDKRRGFVELAQDSAGPVNFSAPGDSGALWCDRTTKRAIAMHIQGDRLGNLAIASTMNFIIDRLDLVIAR